MELQFYFNFLTHNQSGLVYLDLFSRRILTYEFHSFHAKAPLMTKKIYVTG